MTNERKPLVVVAAVLAEAMVLVWVCARALVMVALLMAFESSLP